MDNPDELFTVVDKDDNVIEYRSRYDCHHDKSLIHRAVGIVIFNDKGQILLQKRSQNKDLYPGMYTMSASGHVDKGEEYLQTAERELQEELGVKTDLDKQKTSIVESAEETEMFCLFTAKHNGPFNPESREVAKVIFMDIDNLKSLESQLTSCAKASLEQLGLL